MIVVFTFLLFTFCIYLRYRSGKWKNIKVIDSSELKAEIQNEGVI
jgi:hypothetical protein